MELGSGRRSGDRGIEEGPALCDFCIALRHEPPPVIARLLLLIYTLRLSGWQKSKKKTGYLIRGVPEVA